MQKFSSTWATTASASATFDPSNPATRIRSPRHRPGAGAPFFSPFGATKMVLLAASAMSFDPVVVLLVHLLVVSVELMPRDDQVVGLVVVVVGRHAQDVTTLSLPRP
jgi:hypothetical protein